MMQITEGDFITVLVREDLTPGYKVVQTSHALADFAIKHSQEFKEWQQGSNYLCCLESSTEEIETLISRLEDYNIKYCIFREPDVGNQMTAIAVQAIPKKQHNKLFKNFKLTLNEKI